MATTAGEYWHIVATGLPFDFPPAEPDESAPQLAERARDAGAFVAIAHPSWSQLTIEDGRSLGAAHAVEVYNHTCAVMTDRGDGFYLLDQLCNEDRRLTAVAGDDAHFHNGDLDAFGAYVMVKSESLEPESLLGALKAGEFYSTQGPRIHSVDLTCKGSAGRVLSGPHHRARHRRFAGGEPRRTRAHPGDDRIRRSREMGLARPAAGQMVPHRRH